MSLQWTLIAGFLYIEMAIVLLLVLPVVSPKRWNAFFKLRFLQELKQQTRIYFLIWLGIIVLFLLEAIREMRKYSSIVVESQDPHQARQHLNVEMQDSMRLLRAQRSFYISGFALFLPLVIRRLVTLIASQAALLAQSEAALKQAQSATSAAEYFMSQRGEVVQNESNEEHYKEAAELKKKLKELEDKLGDEVKDKTALKSQAENLSKQYDSLAEDYSNLQKQITASGDNGSKKSN